MQEWANDPNAQVLLAHTLEDEEVPVKRAHAAFMDAPDITAYLLQFGREFERLPPGLQQDLAYRYHLLRAYYVPSSGERTD